jgi:hypothetical protein
MNLALLTASAAVVSSVLCTPVHAQWSIGAEVGGDRYWGGSVEKEGLHRSFRPFRPTTLGISLAREGRLFSVGVRMTYSSAGMALEGDEAVSVIKGVFTMYSVAPEVSYHIATMGQTNRLVLHGGPLFEIWRAVDESSETRLGAHCALSLNVPLGRKFAASLAAGAAVIGSPFAEQQLVAGFERKPLWRRRFAAGLQYRL